MKHKSLALVCILGAMIGSCKGVRSDGSRIVNDDGSGMEVEASPDSSVAAASPAAVAVIPTKPMAEVMALTSVQVKSLITFSMRSLNIGTAGESLQYRVDLSANTVAIDALSEDNWVERSKKTLTASQADQVKNVLSSLKPSNYPKCETCPSESHMFVLESSIDGKLAKSFAMKEECVCGEGDERTPNVSYSGLNELSTILR